MLAPITLIIRMHQEYNIVRQLLNESPMKNAVHPREEGHRPDIFFKIVGF